MNHPTATTTEHARQLLARATELAQLAYYIDLHRLSRDDILQEIHIRTHKLEAAARLPATTETLHSTPHCCLAGCGKAATWEISSHRPTHSTNRYTLACTAHVGDLLDADAITEVAPLTTSHTHPAHEPLTTEQEHTS